MIERWPFVDFSTRLKLSMEKGWATNDYCCWVRSSSRRSGFFSCLSTNTVVVVRGFSRKKIDSSNR